jgi:aminopeptidase YwaD
MKKILFLITLSVVFSLAATAQITPWLQWTLLSEEEIAEIVGESSGETAWNSISTMGGYNHNRPEAEYAGTFLETSYITNKLKEYGLAGVDVVRIKPTPNAWSDGTTWDGISGELWEISPKRQKLASYQDMSAMLASGSTNTDVKAELVWVGRGTEKEIDEAEVAGKIVVTEGRLSSVHNYACITNGALGVVAISTSREHLDPLQIPISGIRGDKAKFGFYLTARDGAYLKNRLIGGQKITVHAQVESAKYAYDMENPTCIIPGSDPEAGEILLSAHLFEGFVKQGANDNISGSAAILEVARTLNTLIAEGRLAPPKRTIRFIWGPEYSGTGAWARQNVDLMAQTLCNINMDMVGETLSLNKSYMNMMRTTYGNPHYINDVMENYYRFVGEGNHERIQNRSGFDMVPDRIVAPTGTDEPFYYSIETHYGASDHEVFNDWGVQVPGVMMIVWPDQWYHTSGDRADKSDPTQLKRVVIISAASAYTIANADDDMVIKIAGEIASNATRRIGHKFIVAQDLMNNTTAETFQADYKLGRVHIQSAMINELETLDSVLELATDEKAVAAYVGSLKETVSAVAKAQMSGFAAFMEATAKRLGVAKTNCALGDLEQKAAGLVYTETAKVKAGGYSGYRTALSEALTASGKKFPRTAIANTTELHVLIDGKHNALQIKMMLDAQYKNSSDLQTILDYLEVLEAAGLVTK